MRTAMRGRLAAMLLALLLLAGLCVPSEADILKIPVEEEISVGREASREFEAEVRFLGGPELARIRRIGARVAAATGRKDLPWEFKLVDDESVNAITFPGGYIYVFRGLIDAQPDDDELAGVLGHEVVHATKSHAFKRLFPALLLKKTMVKLTGKERENAVTQVVQVLTMRGLGRRFELEADWIGVEVANAAGFDPEGLLHVLDLFQQMEGKSPTRMQRLLLTHPPPADRIKRVKPHVEELKRQG